MTNGKKTRKIVSKLTRTVRRSTYHDLKNKAESLANEIDLQLSGKPILTLQEEKIKEKVRLLRELIEKQGKVKETETDSGLNEELEQIKDDLVTLRDQLKKEQNARADAYRELTVEKEKVAQLETALATAQEEQNTRPSAQEFQRIKEEQATAREERDQAQQNLDELRAELDEMDELLANKNSQIGELVKERDSRPTNQQWMQNQQKLIKIIAEAKKWKTKYTNSEWEIKYNELLQISFALTENNEKLKEEHEKELEKLKNQENTPQKKLNEGQKEVNLLRETSETLKKENQVLKEIIASLKSDNPQNLIQNQQTIERLEERLVDCCSECLVGKEEQEEGLSEAKKEIFQLCERLDVILPEWLEEKIKSAATYKQLVKSLSDIHDRRAIIEIQKAQAEKSEQFSGESFTSAEPRKEINPGVKQFLWITGILALISSILAIVKKWKSARSRKK